MHQRSLLSLRVCQACVSESICAHLLVGAHLSVAYPQQTSLSLDYSGPWLSTHPPTYGR